MGLLIAGGLEGLQAGAIATALPFSVIMIAMCLATYRMLDAEHQELMATERRIRQRELTGKLHANFDENFGEQVDDRIDYALTSTTGIWGREGKRSPVTTMTRARRRRRGERGE